MEIKTQCPHCQGRYLVEDDMVGETISCVRCNAEFVVALYVPPPPTPVAAPQRAKIRLKQSEPAKPGADADVMHVAAVDMDLVAIHPGSFRQGAENGYANERPVRNVTLAHPFWMARHPVTQRQFWELMHKNPSYFEGEDLPVETVSWNEALDFCRRLTEVERVARRIPSSLYFRLPTEAEWEYCCRAGGGASGTADPVYYFGNDPALLPEHAWFDANSDGSSHPVGTLRPNAWKLYDMLGNVAEWCQDWYAPYAAGDVTDPKGPETGRRRVRRGGGWSSTAMRCRCADRIGVSPDCASALIGFRVVAVRAGEPPYSLNYHVW